MKNNLLICIICLCVFLLVIYMLPESNEELSIARESEMEDVTELRYPVFEENTYTYYLKEENEQVVVYRMKDKKRILITGITMQSLPEEMKRKIQEGYYLKNDLQLQDFLESYSS